MTGLTNLYLKLNNFNYKDEHLNIVKQFLINNILPKEWDEEYKLKFRNQYKDFVYENNNIIFKPLNLIVVREEEKEKILKELYADPVIGINAGIKSFYNKVRAKYLGIKRDDIKYFLENQQPYQLTKKNKPLVNRPIIGKYANHRWAIDLIDMNYYSGQNRNYKWILTAIDYFSKKVFAIGMKNKTGETTRDALDELCENVNTYPKIIQSDNGGEFIDQSVKDWALEYHIKLVRTLSYTPTSNGLIENFNNILRKMIREGFIRNNNFNWIDHLDDYIENRNESKHGTTKYTPNQIWTEGQTELEKIPKARRIEIEEGDDILDDNEKLIKVKFRLEEKAKKMLDKETELFQVGDSVRVLMSSLHSDVRKMVKANRGKYIVVRYSPQIYYVKEILKPNAKLRDFQNTRYTLQDDNGNKLLTEIKLNNPNAPRDSKIFFGSELQRIDLQKVGKSILSTGEADKLNKINTPEFKEMIKEIDDERKRNKKIISDQQQEEEKEDNQIRKSERLKKKNVEPQLIEVRRSDRLKKSR